MHVLDTARALAPGRICVIYGHGGETVPERVGGNDITWARQMPQLGTGHAVMQALPYLGKEGVTLVLYGDVPLTGIGVLKDLTAATAGNSLALLTVKLTNPAGYGRIIRNSEGNVVAIVEEKDATETQKAICEINTGIMAVPNRHLHGWLGALENNNAQKEYYLTDIVAMAVKDRVPVNVVQSVHEWETMGINSKAQLAMLERTYQSVCADRLLQQGVTLADPARIDIRGQLDCGSDVEIDINCIFEGHVKLGNNVKVGAHSILKNVQVAAGTVIAPFSLIEDAGIGENCHIGPYARIRPGTVLADKVHIGNFVEIKNSQIADGSKANHLSYIGDSTVGTNVNIGAGTITCNYDGANKYRTVIEDNVFIGSDTQLIAPVRIAKGSTIGAGSTITKDTPPEELTLSRTRQISIAGWKRPVKNTKQTG